MLIENIRFKNRQSLKIEITTKSQIAHALKSLGLEAKRPVIVIIGGAGGIQKEDWEAIEDIIKTIAELAQKTGAAIIDGGTKSGVMAAIGQARADQGYQFPLIGVSAEGTVRWPRRKSSLSQIFSRQNQAAPLDPHHTHFILVPGKEWGDESAWIAEVASQLAGECPSVAVLINGGAISRDLDVPNNLAAGRTVLVIDGTGRASDEFATHPPDTDLMHFVHVSELERLVNELQHHFLSAA